MHTYRGSCQCGNLAFSIQLPQPIERYTARRCDCEFCTRHGMDYLSSADGSIELTFHQDPERIRQGDELARFLGCAGCGQVVAVLYDRETPPIGAVNARMLKPPADIGTEGVSPRLLPADQKLERWRTLWCPLSLSRRPAA